MAKQPKSVAFDPAKWAESLVLVGKNLGTDALVYSIVGIGSFGSLWSGSDASATVSLATIVLSGWFVSKLLNAYMHDRHERQELERLRLTQGSHLIEKHKDKQARLPLKERKKNGDKGNG